MNPTLLASGQQETYVIRHDADLSQGNANSVAAGVFGILVQLASALVEHYHGDLYHDAAWLRERLTEARLQEAHATTELHCLESTPIVSFGFGVRDTGTQIGRDMDLIKRYNDRAYQVIVTRSRSGRFSVNVWRAK